MSLKKIIEELQKLDKKLSGKKVKNESNYTVPDLSKYDDCKLCYIEDNTAYFTRKPLDEVWGDDWDDAPYEHNAGRPYEYDLTIMFQGDNLRDPSYMRYNSPYSVRAINSGATAWLTDGENVSIQAGVSPEEFIELVLKVGDSVYLPVLKSGESK